MLNHLFDTLSSVMLALLSGPNGSTGEGLEPIQQDVEVQNSGLTVTGLPEEAPLIVSAQATETELVVEVSLDSGWHLYSRDVGGGRPVAIELGSDSPFAAAGSLVTPGDAKGEIAGKARLVLPLERTGPGSAIEATFALQVCDALECLEPMSLTLQGEVAPARVLLVVANEDERVGRIHAWLQGRQFHVALATYEDVSTELCDAHDVVLADSHYYGEHDVDRNLIHAFPRTSSPVVAVGYLGTELVEAHEVAMTSGYI